MNLKVTGGDFYEYYQQNYKINSSILLFWKNQDIRPGLYPVQKMFIMEKGRWEISPI